MGWLLKWSSVGDVLLRSGVNKVLPLAGFCPDSQNRCSDGAKIEIYSESSKYFGNFLSNISETIINPSPTLAQTRYFLLPSST